MVVPGANQKQYFKITDTKLYVPVVTLSTPDKIRLLKQLESGFERTINWSEYLPKANIYIWISSNCRKKRL